MEVLRGRLQTQINEFMTRAERANYDYVCAALEAVATMAEEATMLLACIDDDEYRGKCVAELLARIPAAVEIRHAQLAEAQRSATRQ